MYELELTTDYTNPTTYFKVDYDIHSSLVYYLTETGHEIQRITLVMHELPQNSYSTMHQLKTKPPLLNKTFFHQIL